MSDINKSPQHVAKLSNHGYDMHQRVKTTSPVGLLVPVYQDVLNAGEKVSINDSVFTITDAFNKYTLNHFKEHIDYFFVPYPLIWSLWESFRPNINDIRSSAFVGRDGLNGVNSNNVDALRKFPTANFDHIVHALADFQTEDWEKWYSYEQDNLDAFQGVYRYPEALRLLESVGIGIDNFALVSSFFSEFDYDSDVDEARRDKGDSIISEMGIINQRFNLHFLAAYQAVYQNWYRLDDYEQKDTASFNLDVSSVPYHRDYTSTSSTSGISYGSSIQQWQVKKLLTPRYRPWKKDLFTNIKPQPLFNPASLNFFGSDSQLFFDIPKSTDYSSVDSGGESVYSVSIGNVMDIRQSFMFEKYLQITQHAKKSYDAQMLAHFGISIPRDVKHEIEYIGSHTNEINVQGVEATAAGSYTTGGNTSSSVLGELGSRGVGVRNGSKPLSFKAPCDGILIGIYSIVPESDYKGVGLDKLNLLEDWSDWFTPEFDKQGMVPMFAYEGKSSLIEQGFGFRDLITLKNRVAWRYPYTEFKQKYDKVLGALSRSRESWNACRVPFSGNGSLTAPVLHISPNYTDAVTLLRYAVNPKNFDFSLGGGQGDEAVANNYVRNRDRLFMTDAFIHSFDFNIKKSSTMSPYGLFDL